MNVIIRSQVEATIELQRKPGFWHVVSIREPLENAAIDRMKEKAVSFIPLSFHDIWSETQTGNGRYVLASREQVAEVLAWAKGKDNILVHCHAGISRSSAMAFVIACQVMPVADALKILDFKVHWPNTHIVALGEAILGKKILQEVKDAMHDFLLHNPIE